jgi:Protein of unknown function (DUF993)
MIRTISLPTRAGMETYSIRDNPLWPKPTAPASSRLAYAAAHVVADPRADNTPGAPAGVNWDETMAFRRHLWSYGFAVADAMDTAQRGMGLDWAATRELIRRSAAEAQACGGVLACGAGTDQLNGGPVRIDDVIHAYQEQVAFVHEAGARAILMASRQLAAVACGPDDYRRVYDEVLAQTTGRVILHWLGPMFDPLLEGYWGSTDLEDATATVLSIVADHAERIDGIKVSLLDKMHEVRLRRALPPGVRLYTGDDFNYPELIRGDEQGHSDALLGIFAAIAPAAASALAALDRKDLSRYSQILEPTVPLARQIFSAPTRYYKTGITFLAWLTGLQSGFVMVAGLQSARSILHLCETFRLADQAGLLVDADLAVHRMRGFLGSAGLDAA